MSALTVMGQTVRIWKDEWRLQGRNWGTWLVGLFFLAVVLSEHPSFSGTSDYSLSLAASLWADRVSIVGSLVAILTVPFALDRVRRQRVAQIEFTKPFEKSAYALGKFAGAVSPLVLVTTFSLIIHMGITLATQQNINFGESGVAYLEQTFLTAFGPLLYIASLVFCASIFIRRPIIIIPISLSYLILTTATQAIADAKFSWFSPIVRPEYFGGIIPDNWMPLVLKHHAVYLVLSVGLLALAAIGFQRYRFLDNKLPTLWWKGIHLPVLSFISMKFRMLWNGSIVAAILMAVVAVANTMSNPNLFLRLEYAFFGLEFYLSLSGLLIIAGVLSRDKNTGILELVLTKPTNRWRLLGDRLLPALAFYGLICLLSVGILNILYEPLPIGKTLLISLSTGIYLGLFGMTVANVTKNTLAGIGAGMIYWFIEAAFNGRFTAPFYLLIVSHQIPLEAGEVWANPVIWLPIKIGALVLAILLFIANGWLLDNGPARRHALTAILLGYPLVFAIGWWLIPVFIG